MLSALTQWLEGLLGRYETGDLTLADPRRHIDLLYPQPRRRPLTDDPEEPMTTTPAGLGVLAVDVAGQLTASGVLATTSIAHGGVVEVVVQVDRRRGQLAAITAGQWGTAVVHTPGEPDQFVSDLLGDYACDQHAHCLSVWLWGWVVRHRGTRW